MILTVYVDDVTLPIKVPEFVLQAGNELFAKMDADMDRGWQMSRSWVDNPDLEQRCQIVADRLLGAIENENQKLAAMMAGYILARAPNVKAVQIATNGEMQETELLTKDDLIF